MWKLIALLGLLQALDCFTTWIAGIEREENLLAAAIWRSQGFGTVVFCKMAIVVGLALLWHHMLRLDRLSPMPKLVRVLWTLGLCGFITIMTLAVSWNFSVLAVNVLYDAWP